VGWDRGTAQRAGGAAERRRRAISVAAAATAATASAITIGVVELPPPPLAVGSGRGEAALEAVARRLGEPGHGGDRRSGECGAGLLSRGRQAGEREPGRAACALDAVSGGHHDQQRMRALEADLPVEEGGVLLRVAEQLGDDSDAISATLIGNPARLAAAVSALRTVWTDVVTAGMYG